MLPFLRAALCVLVLSAFHGLLSAQCPIPDALDGGACCAAAQEKLPVFPNFVQDTMEVCWRQCDVEAVTFCSAKWKKETLFPATGPDCSYRQYTLELRDAAATLKWAGRMRALYARTWVEEPAAGQRLQVWRFLVNGDLKPTAAAGPIPCPVPSCVPAFGRARFTGYLDYALDCATGLWSSAWMLTHACDRIDHAPGFPRGGAFHPDRTYSFVGPAASFVPGPLVATEPGGAGVFEDIRGLRIPPPGVAAPIECEFEEQIQYVLDPLTDVCLCVTASPFLQYRIANLSVFGACGTTLTTPGAPFLPGYVSMSVGSFVDPTTYPGVEDVRWTAGGYRRDDPCTGITMDEVYFGATTIGGYPAFQVLTGPPGGPLPLIFIDQANSRRLNFPSPLMNTPFLSDQILNLNL